MRARWRAAASSSVVALCVVLTGSCGFDRADRWLLGDGPPPSCKAGERRCGSTGIERCSAGSFVIETDCAKSGLVCVPATLECRTCVPQSGACDGQLTLRCDDSGDGYSATGSCDPTSAEACRAGACVNLCKEAQTLRSNVGCEYWAVDLDNANVGTSLNAAAQQFAVVVSNPQPDVPVAVVIERDDTAPGDDNEPLQVATATISPLSLRVFKLGPREVDGSPPGEFNTGTHTALTRAAYRVRSDFPVVAYQFNPLENVNVFSNDASLLKPVEALGTPSASVTPAYVVLGWPQTIASTEDPKTNFNASAPIDLRAFLTIVGTRPNTRVKIDTTALVIGGGPVPTTPIGGVIEVELGPFDVLNLETDDFGADFSGSLVSSDQPVVVFSGGEASDAPMFPELAYRRCCADHLEEQLDPIRTAGRRFVASVSANRSEAVAAAGATIGVVPQPEYFRVIAVTPAGARLTTTLPPPYSEIVLPARGSFATLESTSDFMIDSDAPVMLASVSPSQEAAGIPRGLPGGDPSLLVIPPLEQFRSSYVFLTPDKYSFDFIRIVAPSGAVVVLDGERVDQLDACRAYPADGLTDEARGGPPPFVVYRCQLSFPIIDPDKDTNRLLPGLQNDGVHRVDATSPVGVLVEGFDAFVSYAYAAGTELVEIVPQ